ncbi:MAG: biotin/lipoyl-binding protein [Clostridia bacterium]|nr:biotin/lipoyl-binding protein [Clostridia bacterium]
MKRNFLITVNGQKYDVSVVDKDAAGSTAEEVTKPDLREVPKPAVTEASAGSANTGGASGQGKATKAPMAGKIISVLVDVGEMVERGQPLVVLEAMKLENDIVAPQDGRIEQVLVKPGQLVETGDDLVLIS